MNVSIQLTFIAVLALAAACQQGASKNDSPTETQSTNSPGSPDDLASSDSDEQTNESQSKEVALVRIFSDLPECNKKSEGKVFFVFEEQKFRYCRVEDRSWSELDLKGPKGEAGDALQGPAGLTSLVSVNSEPQGSNCSNGGNKIQSGIDENSNGILDGSEVESTSFSCNGLDGGAASAGKNSLVSVTQESAGGNCSAGGYKIQTGLDNSGNNILDAGEIIATSYVCNGIAGSQGVQGQIGNTGSAGASGKNSVFGISTESAGANCPVGGKKIQVGIDDNANATLDLAEVDATTYVCNSINSAGLFDANDKLVCVPFDVSFCILSDGALIGINTKTGLAGSGRYYSSSGEGASDCYFESTDCSGTCYLANAGALSIVPNRVFAAPNNSLLKTTGSEVDAGSKTFGSYFSGGTCYTSSSTISRSFAITNSYSLPSGLSYPFPAPLQFRLIQN